MNKKTYVSPLCKTYPLAEKIEFLALTGGDLCKTLSLEICLYHSFFVPL